MEEKQFACTYVHTYHSRFNPEMGSRSISDIPPRRPTSYLNHLAMSNTAEVTDGKSIAVWSQCISGVNAINPLATFYDFHKGKREFQFQNTIRNT
jgi:hypothetical protein